MTIKKNKKKRFLARTISNHKVACTEDFGPPSLSFVEDVGGLEIFQVSMIRINHHLIRTATKHMSPSFEAFYNDNHSLIMDIIIEFGWTKVFTVKGYGMPFLV